MAHTVKTLSKLLKKTPTEVINILLNAGVKDKQEDSEISTEERKILMGNLSKRLNTNKSSAYVSHKASNKSSNYSANVQVKKKRITRPDNATTSDAIEEQAIKAQKALEAGREQDEKLREQDEKLRNVVLLQKQQEKVAQQEEEPQKEEVQQQEAPQKEDQKETTQEAVKKQPEKQKPKETQTNKQNKPAKRLRNNATIDGRKQLHIANKNPKRKLKKKDRTRISHKIQEEQAQHAFKRPEKSIIEEILIPENIKVSVLAQQMKTKAGEVLKVLMGMGVMATLNDVIDQDTAMLVVEEMGHKGIASKTESIEDSLIVDAKNPGETGVRPPVVTIMGHVDHGKTTLLDYIRKTKIANAESGGITQHIGAYQVKSGEQTITFIDTPGHAMFAKMRNRGASTTDIVILVVAADDGVMPQTIESIKHAKSAKVPIIVAINKMDKEGVTTDKIKQMLSTYDVLDESWGGDVMMIPLSAQTGQGVEQLLEAIALTAEMLELQAPIKQNASGTVLEARLDKGRGKVTTILVKSGTLKKNDVVLAGLEYGKVKQIINDLGLPITSAGPSMPVEILGLSGVPNSGDEFLVVENERKAREVANFRKSKDRETKLQKQQAEKMQGFLLEMTQEKISVVSILIKADVRGSTQALVEALEELSTEEVKVKIVLSGVGAISNTDINLASAAKAIVLGFNVRADAVARRVAENEKVTIEYYSVVYNLIDDVKAIMSGMLSPELSENIVGIALVKEVFKSPKFGDVAGCIVEEGVVKRDNPIRVLRDSVVIYEGELESLRRFKENANEVKSGVECGIGVLNYKDVQAGDQIEVFERIERARSI